MTLFIAMKKGPDTDTSTNGSEFEIAVKRLFLTCMYKLIMVSRQIFAEHKGPNVKYNLLYG